MVRGRLTKRGDLCRVETISDKFASLLDFGKLHLTPRPLATSWACLHPMLSPREIRNCRTARPYSDRSAFGSSEAFKPYRETILNRMHATCFLNSRQSLVPSTNTWRIRTATLIFDSGSSQHHRHLELQYWEIQWPDWLGYAKR